MKKDKKKLITSVLAGFLAFVLVFGLVASVIPLLTSAKTEDLVPQQVNTLTQQN